MDILACDSKLNVLLDEKALNDASIASDTPSRQRFRPNVIAPTARFLLHQCGLVLQEDPHALVITTSDAADTMLNTEIYPAADLLLTDRVADRSLLVDPYLDRELAAEVHIRGKLQRPVSLEFHETPLDQVLESLAGTLDDTIVMDQKAMDDASIATDTPITTRLRGMPARDALRWILRNAGLTYMVQGEALVVTTPDAADCQLPIRLHSGRGLVYEYLRPAGGGRKGPLAASLALVAKWEREWVAEWLAAWEWPGAWVVDSVVVGAAEWGWEWAVAWADFSVAILACQAEQPLQRPTAPSPFPAAVIQPNRQSVLSPRHLAKPVPHPLTFPDRITSPMSIPSKR